MDKKIKPQIIQLGKYKALYIPSDPPRVEAKIILERDNIGQKLIFKIMEITHEHGFGCSPPTFNGPTDPNMIFRIGTVLSNKRFLKSNGQRLEKCLDDLDTFFIDFNRQLNFKQLDISMFKGIDTASFNPEHLAALRDQHYAGSWNEFYASMLEQNKKEEAEVIRKCIKFEKINQKDIGLIGYKLTYLLYLLEDRAESARSN